MSQPHDTNPKRPVEKATLGGETVEPRILLSASWLVDLMGALPDATPGDTGGGGDDLMVGDAGDNTLDGGDGNDILRGNDGDDTLIGGRGYDIADYSTARSGVSVDLSAGTAAGGAGTDTLTGIEGAFGSTHDDTFAFTNAAHGEVYTVAGNDGADTLNLIGFPSSAATFADGSLTVDLGNGESFRIDYADIETITFGDISATVLTGNHADPAFSGDHLYVDGNHAFGLSFTGGGEVDWCYDTTADTLSIAGFSGGTGSSSLQIDDLGTGSLTVDSISFNRQIASITSSVDLGAMDLGNWSPDTITVADGTGAIGSITVQCLTNDLGIDASVGAFTVSNNLNQDLTVSGDLGSLTIHGSVDGDIVIDGDLKAADISNFGQGGSLTVHHPAGTVALTINQVANDIDTGGSPFVYDSAAGTISFLPQADAGPDQAVDEGTLVALDATASSDADGDPLSYTWIQLSGPTVTLSDSSAARPNFTAPEGLTNSTAVFELTVSDGQHVAIDVVEVAINADNDAPTADAGTNQAVSEGSVAVLDGRASSDPEGQALSYSWRQIAGPTVNIVNANAAVAGFVVPEALSNSNARFELTVSDGTSTSVDTVDLLLRADDDAPTAKAGIDRTVDEGQIVVLDGSKSTDPEGRSLTYTWEQISGPPVKLQAVPGTPTLPTVPGVPTSIGSVVYGASVSGEGRMAFQAPEGITNSDATFSLTVSDGTSTSVDTVTIHINANDDAPVVSTGPNQLVAAQQTVTLAATAQDPEGQNLRYQWTQVSGPAVQLSGADTSNPTFVTPTGHTGEAMVFVVAVTDGTSTAYDTVAVGIHNTPPVVVAGSPGDATSGEPVVLAATANDIDGDNLTYRWTQVSGPSVTITASNHNRAFFQAPTVQSPTQLMFEVEVDDGHTTSTRRVMVTVAPQPEPEPPVGGKNDTLPATVPNDPQPQDPPTSSPPAQTVVETSPSGGNGSEPPVVPSIPETRSGNGNLGQSGSPHSDNERDDSDSDSDSERGSDAVDAEGDDNQATDDVQQLVAGEAVIASAGSEIDIAMLLAVPEGAEDVQFTWKQLSGTAVTILDGSGLALRIQLPESFSTEELVFEVEMMVDGQIIVQEVRVEVQPVDGEAKAAALAQQHQYQRLTGDGEAFEAHRGIGKVWASLVAFTSMGPRRPKA